MNFFALLAIVFGTNNVVVDATNQVNVTIYYETLCPLSRQVYTQNLVPVMKNLSEYITLKTNPYGFAQTFLDEHGGIKFECQHGPAECYGNKIQACALKYLSNLTEAVVFNGCMMENGRDASDESTKECASRIGFDADPIAKCAVGDEGSRLLKEYGAETSQLDLPYMPAVLVNGNVNDDPNGRHLYSTICKAFAVKPTACV